MHNFAILVFFAVEEHAHQHIYWFNHFTSEACFSEVPLRVMQMLSISIQNAVTEINWGILNIKGRNPSKCQISTEHVVTSPRIVLSSCHTKNLKSNTD
jgi:hypothetical protein